MGSSLNKICILFLSILLLVMQGRGLLFDQKQKLHGQVMAKIKRGEESLGSFFGKSEAYVFQVDKPIYGHRFILLFYWFSEKQNGLPDSFLDYSVRRSLCPETWQVQNTQSLIHHS